MTEEKPEGRFQELRKAGKASRAINEHWMRFEQEKRDSGELPWQIFRTDMRKYVSVVENAFPGSAGRIKRKIERAHARGEKVVVLEIGGCADATSIGADFTVAIMLPEPETPEELEQRKRSGATVKISRPRDKFMVLRGNALSHRGLQEFIRVVREEVPKEFPGEKTNVLLAFVFPGGAARHHSSNPVSRSRAGRLMHDIHHLLSEDGEMYNEFVFADAPVPKDVMEKAIDDPNAVVQRTDQMSMFRVSKKTSSE